MGRKDPLKQLIKHKNGVPIWYQGVVLRLRNRRIELGINQNELAERIGVSTWLVGRWENFERTPRLFLLNCWAEALGCYITMPVIHNQRTHAEVSPLHGR